MPTPLEFMERVLPWPGPDGSGWGNLHWHLTTPDQKKLWRGAPYKTAEQLIQRAQMLSMQAGDKAADIFFCTSIQSQTETITHGTRQFVVASRHATTATAIKAIFLDVDIKTPPKGYTNLKEALDEITKFYTAAGLPGPSALVLSGGGVHVYWISSRALSIAEWRPFAEGLKAEAMRLGLRADYGVTADPARILRVPGTFNRKIAGTPRPVKVLGLGRDYDFATDLACLATIGAPLVTATVTKAAPFDLSAFQGGMHPLLAAALANCTDKLSDGIDRYNDMPLDPTEVIKGCPHFTEAAHNHGQGHGQGLWMLTVLASTWFENGNRWARRFSDGYPSYDRDEFDAMWARKMDDRAKGVGWPSCKSFENEGCKHCATCVYKPQGKSPLNLAQRVKPPEPDPATQVVTNPITQVQLTAASLNLPDGYVLWDGLICKKVQDPDDQMAAPEYIPVFIGEVISVPQVSNHRPPTLFFKYQQGPGNYVEVVIPYTAYASDQSLATEFLSQGILTDTRSDKFVRAFMRSWVSRIDLAFKRLTTAPLGWVVEPGAGSPCGFAYGGKLFMADGTEEDSGLAGEGFQKYVPSGDEAPIHDALTLVSQRHVPALEVLTLQSWASPLVEISGLKSTAIVWGYSKDGGRGKSTSLRTGMALWGAPDKCRMKGGATMVGLENTFNRIRNLPGQVDELTDEIAIDKIAGIFQNMGEGGQGVRGTRNGGVREDRSWQLNLTCGSNTSLRQYQARKGVDTNAKATRVFEIKVEAPNATTHSMTYVDQLIGSLEYNYGHLGLRYAKYLAMNHQLVKDRFNAIDARTIADLKIVGNEERYWKTTVSLTMLAAELANEITGKPYFHVDAIRQFLYDTYNEHRMWVSKHVDIAGTGMHTEEAWNRLLGVWIANQLITDTMGGGAIGRTATAVQIKMHPDYGREYITKIHWLQEPPMVRIAYSSLIDTLTELKMGTEMADTFQKLFGGTIPRKVFLAGIPVQEAKTRIKVWEIPITPGHMLYKQWADKVQEPEPANATSAAAQAQDAGLLAGAAQAAKDLAVVRGATGSPAPSQ